MTALSDLLAEANVQGWSSREIARRAEKNGHKLSFASSAVYLGGRHGVPTEAVLAAFSDVLNIPINKLRTAAGVPVGEGSPWAPPSEANRLDLRQRRALEELIRSMVASETPREDQDDDQQHPHTREDPPAQRRGLEGPALPDGLTPDRGGHRAWGEARRAAFDRDTTAPTDDADTPDGTDEIWSEYNRTRRKTHVRDDDA